MRRHLYAVPDDAAHTDTVSGALMVNAIRHNPVADAVAILRGQLAIPFEIIESLYAAFAPERLPSARRVLAYRRQTENRRPLKIRPIS